MVGHAQKSLGLPEAHTIFDPFPQPWYLLLLDALVFFPYKNCSSFTLKLPSHLLSSLLCFSTVSSSSFQPSFKSIRFLHPSSHLPLETSSLNSLFFCPSGQSTFSQLISVPLLLPSLRSSLVKALVSVFLHRWTPSPVYFGPYQDHSFPSLYFTVHLSVHCTEVRIYLAKLSDYLKRFFDLSWNGQGLHY